MDVTDIVRYVRLPCTYVHFGRMAYSTVGTVLKRLVQDVVGRVVYKSVQYKTEKEKQQGLRACVRPSSCRGL